MSDAERNIVQNKQAFAQVYSLQDDLYLKCLVEPFSTKSITQAKDDDLNHNPFSQFFHDYGYSPEIMREMYRVLKIRDAYTPNYAGISILSPEITLSIISGLAQGLSEEDMKQQLRMHDSTSPTEMNPDKVNKSKLEGARNWFGWALTQVLDENELASFCDLTGQARPPYNEKFKPRETIEQVLRKLNVWSKAMRQDPLRRMLAEQPHIDMLIQLLVQGESIENILSHFQIASSEHQLIHYRRRIRDLILSQGGVVNILQHFGELMAHAQLRNTTAWIGETTIDERIMAVGTVLHEVLPAAGIELSQLAKVIAEQTTRETSIKNPATIHLYLKLAKDYFRLGALGTFSQDSFSKRTQEQSKTDEQSTEDDLLKYYKQFYSENKKLPEGYRRMFFARSKVMPWLYPVYNWQKEYLGNLPYSKSHIENMRTATGMLIQNLSLNENAISICKDPCGQIIDAEIQWPELFRRRSEEINEIEAYLRTL